MASSSSSTQPGTSSSSISHDDFDEDMVALLLVGDQRAPEFKQELQCNGIKLVPSTWEKCDASQNCRLVEVWDNLKEELVKFQSIMTDRGRTFDLLPHGSNHELDAGAELFKSIVKSFHDESGQQKTEINELKQKLKEEEDHRKKEKLESERKLQEVKAELERKFRKEKYELERKLGEERNRIVALKNEQGRMTDEKFKTSVFLRQLADLCEFKLDVKDDPLSSSVQEKLLEHVQNVTMSEEDKEDLVWSRGVANQLNAILYSSPRHHNSTATPTRRPPLPQETLLSSPSPVTSTTITPMDIDVGPAPAIPPSRQPSPPTSTPPPSPPIEGISTSLPASTSSSAPVRKTSVNDERVSSSQPEEDSILLEEETPGAVVPIVTEPTSENIPRVEVSNEDDDPYTFREDPPSIMIPLLTTSHTAAPDPPSTSRKSPQPPSTSGSTSEQARPVERIRRVRNSGQFTEFAITNKRHAVVPASNQFRCMCGQVYKTRRCVRVHVRKMTQEWKFKCQKCKQYFFFRYDLNNHSKTSRCSQQNGTSATTNNVGHHGDSRQPEAGGGGFSPFNLNDWININVPPPPRPPPRARQQRQQGSSQRQRGGYRKLQQEILKRKQHGPWLSKLGGRVEGSLYCKCMQKFSSKSNLQFHILYWTKEWKFQCPHCERKFFCLSYLKPHMANFHKIPEPLKEYRLGCNLCGEMFHKTVEYHRHKKLKHNPPPKRQVTGALERFRMSSMALTQSQPQPQPSSSTSAVPPPSAPLPAGKIEIVELPSDDEDDEIVEVTPTSLSTTAPPTPSATTSAPSIVFVGEKCSLKRHRVINL